MRVLSVNVGEPREVQWRGKTVLTGIFKSPVQGRVVARKHNLDGDRQADLSVHGGIYKAIYLYPSEHYAYWRDALPDAELSWGNFGENLTTEGLLEEEVRIGDRFRIGSVEVVVSQPRLPCYKLGVRFGRLDMEKRFLKSGHVGFYFSVAEEGDVAAGDTISLLERNEGGMTVAEIVQLVRGPRDPATLQRAAELPALAEGLRDHFRGILDAQNE